MEYETVTLPDDEAWDAFVAANRAAIVEAYGSVEAAYRHACDGGMTLGGGAAPAICVVFAP